MLSAVLAIVNPSVRPSVCPSVTRWQELLAFNNEKFRGSREPGLAPFWKQF